MRRYLFLFLLLIINSSIIPKTILFNEQNLNTREKLKYIDRMFIHYSKAKNKIPRSTLKSWIQIQTAFYEIDLLEKSKSISNNDKWFSGYVKAFGYYVIELFDIAAYYQESLLNTTVKNKKNILLFDYANSLEKIGELEKSINQATLALKALNKKNIDEINNQAFRLLKAKKYEECIMMVSKMPLTKELSHTRLLSARAFAYSNKFKKAKVELNKACKYADSWSCKILDKLKKRSNSSEFWRKDKKESYNRWQPSTFIDEKRIFIKNGIDHKIIKNWNISKMAFSIWFDLIYLIYSAKIIYSKIPEKYMKYMTYTKLGFSIINGVPFLTWRFDNTKNKYVENTMKAFKKSISHASWETKILYTKLKKGQFVAVIVHTDWQKLIIERLNKLVVWKQV